MPVYHVYLSHQPDGTTLSVGEQDEIEASTPEEAAEEYAGAFRDRGGWSEYWSGYYVSALLLDDKGELVGSYGDRSTSAVGIV